MYIMVDWIHLFDSKRLNTEEKKLLFRLKELI